MSIHRYNRNEEQFNSLQNKAFWIKYLETGDDNIFANCKIDIDIKPPDTIKCLECGLTKRLHQFTIVDEEVVCYECSKRKPNTEEEEEEEEEEDNRVYMNYNLYPEEYNYINMYTYRRVGYPFWSCHS
jgi:hypothetical protein